MIGILLAENDFKSQLNVYASTCDSIIESKGRENSILFDSITM